MKLNRTKTFLLASITALTVVGMTVSATAQDTVKGGGGSGWLTQGAEILPMGKKALEVRVGFPSTDVGIRIPVVANLMEVTPFFTMDYLGYAPYWYGYFGDTIGAQLKFKLWSKGQMAISLGFDVGLAMAYVGHPGRSNDIELGIQIGAPEVKFSYRWNNPNIAIIGGFKMPIKVWVYDVVRADIPLLFTIGTEYHVLSNLNIHAHMEIGPEIYAFNGGSDAGAHFGFQFGISYLF